MKYVLVCNAGSSSLKYSLYSVGTGASVGRGEFDRIGSSAPTLEYRFLNHVRQQQLRTMPSHRAATRLLVNHLRQWVPNERDIIAIGHRIVHGGSLTGSCKITPNVFRAIAQAAVLAPLHNPPALEVVREIKRSFSRVPQFAVFDTSFFAHLPAVASTYAIDHHLATRFGIRRHGFHGLSHAGATRRASQLLNKPLRRLNLITIHLGAGCSMTAVRQGKAADTSMGFTPLEGLVMGTRGGDLDPGILTFLLRQGFSLARLEELLDRRSGLLGISGFSADLRDILSAVGHPVPGFQRPRQLHKRERARARLALDIFVYRLRKYVGAYAAILGRVDVVVFTGAIGEHNAYIRRLVLRGMQLSGHPRILAVPTDEEWEIYREVRRLLRP